MDIGTYLVARWISLEFFQRQQTNMHVTAPISRDKLLFFQSPSSFPFNQTSPATTTCAHANKITGSPCGNGYQTASKVFMMIIRPRPNQHIHSAITFVFYESHFSASYSCIHQWTFPFGVLSAGFRTLFIPVDHLFGLIDFTSSSWLLFSFTLQSRTQQHVSTAASCKCADFA